MNRCIRLKPIFIMLLVLLPASACYAQARLQVMSFNIRLDLESDGVNRWDARKEKVAGLMGYYEPDFIGAQEVQHHQLQYLLSTLPRYRSIGVGRDDGKTGGEYSCILYHQSRVEPLRQGTFWLSETPDTVSRGWDAACNRVCSYGLFRVKSTGQRCWVFNTHLDHMGVLARKSAAQLILDRISRLNIEDYPVVLTGDFNARPEEEPVQIISKQLLNCRLESVMPPYGPAATWNAFRFEDIPEGCIDYIFISPRGWKVQKFATLTDSYEKKYPSDHFPVITTLQLLNNR